MEVSTTELTASLADEIEELDLEEIDMERSITELSVWNSINSLFILNRIHQDFGVQLTIEEIRKSQSIKSLVSLISYKQKMKKRIEQ